MGDAAVVVGYPETEATPTEQRNDASTWRGTSIASLTCASIAVGILTVALITRKVLFYDKKYIYESTFYVSVSYYDAYVRPGTSQSHTVSLSVDAATCGNGGKVSTAAAFHYLALLFTVVNVAFLGHEVGTRRYIWHVPLISLILAVCCLLVTNILLGQVTADNEESNTNSCWRRNGWNERVNLQANWCWVLADFAFPLFFIEFWTLLAGRYLRCGCTCCCGGNEPPRAAHRPTVTAPVQVGVPLEPLGAVAVAAGPPAGMQLVQPIDQFGNPSGPPMYVPIMQGPGQPIVTFHPAPQA